MKKFLLITMAIAVTLTGEINIASKFGVGSKVANILNKYGKPDRITVNYFAYNNQPLSGKNTTKVYYHHNGKVFMAAYFIDTSSDGNSCIDEYLNINNLLIKKYGKMGKYIEWKNDLFRNDKSKYGTALLAGFLKIQYDKSIGNITIIHKLYASEYRAYHVLMYIDSKAQKDYLEWKARKNKDDL